mgnify:FL=1
MSNKKNAEKAIPRVLPGGDAVFRKGSSETGLLLLHGYTGSPAEMRYLGERLHEKGFTVSIPRYPGHVTSLYEMVKTSAHDWYTAAREAYI